MISIFLFCKFLKNEDLSQKWAYFTLKLGWLKTSAETLNIRPQNNMYLFAHGERKNTPELKELLVPEGTRLLIFAGNTNPEFEWENKKIMDYKANTTTRKISPSDIKGARGRADPLKVAPK